jgi:hypothetical protein
MMTEQEMQVYSYNYDRLVMYSEGITNDTLEIDVLPPLYLRLFIEYGSANVFHYLMFLHVADDEIAEYHFKLIQRSVLVKLIKTVNKLNRREHNPWRETSYE